MNSLFKIHTYKINKNRLTKFEYYVNAARRMCCFRNGHTFYNHSWDTTHGFERSFWNSCYNCGITWQEFRRIKRRIKKARNDTEKNNT